jgi:hypothetical protein
MRLVGGSSPPLPIFGDQHDLIGVNVRRSYEFHVLVGEDLLFSWGVAQWAEHFFYGTR